MALLASRQNSMIRANDYFSFLSWRASLLTKFCFFVRLHYRWAWKRLCLRPTSTRPPKIKRPRASRRRPCPAISRPPTAAATGAATPAPNGCASKATIRCVSAVLASTEGRTSKVGPTPPPYNLIRGAGNERKIRLAPPQIVETAVDRAN